MNDIRRRLSDHLKHLQIIQEDLRQCIQYAQGIDRTTELETILDAERDALRQLKKEIETFLRTDPQLPDDGHDSRRSIRDKKIKHSLKGLLG